VKAVLIELGIMQQRHEAVLEVLSGLAVVEVARRYEVSRQSLHRWLRRYAASGLAGLADRSRRPASCPHQMAPAIEARIVEMRLAHPRWGPRTIAFYLAKDGVEPLPARSSIYRCLLRHRLIDPQRRRRRREDYRRWERSRAMELWQMDVMGGVQLTDGGELKIVTALDDNSRFCVSAKLVERATARPVCEALLAALRAHGTPEQILTDNGKVFTGRFGLGRGEVLFDRLCREHGIRHLLTAPHSPTTTGKVERFHKSVRAEFLAGRSFATLEEAQEQLDAWVVHYNNERPHQGIGMVAPARRFALALHGTPPSFRAAEHTSPPASASPPRPGEVHRRVGSTGKISLCGFEYRVGSWLAGQTVSVLITDEGLVEISHRGELIVTHARRHRLAVTPRERGPRTESPTAPYVRRRVDLRGAVSFAGTNYRTNKRYAYQQVEVRLAGEQVEIWQTGRLLRSCPARHDPSKEHGAFATPGGRPPKRKRELDVDAVAVTEVLNTICNARGET
jgi:transposase InsO family protein